jgi:outer membrane protein assembly factor BamE (lipoprotein component of BamABCDE complex)
MRAVYSKSHLLYFLFFSALLTLTSCTRGGGSNPFAKDDGEIKENIENLMGLAVGMTKGQVFELSGIANYVEGYDWGSVWFYKIRKGGTVGTLADKDIEQRYMPVVFDNTDRVMGYGRKFYDQTLTDLGTGQF